LFLTKLETIPKALRERLPNLERLMLGCTPLLAVPSNALPLGLIELDLGYGGALRCLPDDVFASLRKLQYLHLGENLLESLPSSLFDPETGPGASLTHLDVHGNALKFLPSAIGSCKALIELNLGRNQLRTLPAELASCKSLRFLHLYENELRMPLPDTFLDAFPNLEQLNWRGNADWSRISEELEHRGPQALLNHLVRAAA
jgi:Leucine-rich repeat (LRR) protein